ncbi:agmatinase [Paenibacillus darwinianus]|uniref:Agmatinase n=1 Tax=Paenibacillus darwinianus TaxID=1380763 RepID=A0A9W5RZS5_9BACL|nr:agmatinase family protein [Paenibacillus darwinianus]EXX86318.1 agmatinase [Paenibacillus darwinianus]EXX86420.1 agmatinase [Paenibacillus darwinianus]EXX88545.1 agmatinase [Paenibacillus darwinianus]
MGFFDNHGVNYRRPIQDEASFERGDLHGIQAAAKEAGLSTARHDEEIRRNLELGLEAAPSIGDRTISTFSRGELPHYAGINTFLKLPYLEDVNRVGEYDVAIMGVPFDIGTTYRSGTRFGPQAIRRISALYQTYNYELGVDLREQLKMCDLGDVFTIANIEKSFDQITKAVSHVMSKGTMPVILGGDHSIGFPCLRGVAENVEGNVGIIHLDRHIDIQEKDMDERMHTTPWFHATNIPNAPAVNLVQIGIGGWQVPRAGVQVGRERGTTIMTINDVESLGIDKVAEMALEVAWKGAKTVYLSFDIDSIDCGFVPGTGWPEPGGFLPREALKLMGLVAKEGIAAMEVVEVAPAYDISDTTALLAARAVLDVLATMVDSGKIGGK